MAELLTSAQNPKFKRLVALREKSRLRRDEGVFVVEGRRELEHCVEAGFEVETVFVCSEVAPPSGVRPSGSPHHPFGTVPPLSNRGCYVPQGVYHQPWSILDVGTGGGFPGIPLAMVMPEAKFTLCDSIGKKVRVAQAVADGLGLKNVECVNARVESLQGQWDWVVSRAVTSLENFYPWVKGRYRNSILYLKGGDIDAEIAALQRKFHIPGANIRTWRIDSWLKDEYFAEKYVIEISRSDLR